MTDRRAAASPTKAFFVRMLTRDISLNDCILDLIDNSIDGAWRESGHEPDRLESNRDLSRFEIKVEASAEVFSISDNCGGISLSDAESYAFTFGRLEGQKTEEYSVGVYGIGMKRAVFKLGNNIAVKSVVRETKNRKVGFVVSIAVQDWLSDTSPDWDFPITDANANDDPGVTITVKELHPEISERLADPEHLRELRAMLARDYLLPLMRGLKIYLNGELVSTEQPTIRESSAFRPMRDKYKDGEVSVEIFSGMWRVPPDDAEPEESSRVDRDSGWYVLCNGRAVLSADRSPVTGWGDDLPRWHSQYGGFIGFVLFASTDPSVLPMTTTKRSVDTSSGVYLRALARMRVPTRAWIDYTNRRKADLESAKTLERQTQAKPISQLPTSRQVALPEVKVPSGPPVANVNYSVEVPRMRALASAFGSRRMTYREVGIRAFDYSYDNLVEEEE